MALNPGEIGVSGPLRSTARSQDGSVIPIIPADEIEGEIPAANLPAPAFGSNSGEIDPVAEGNSGGRWPFTKLPVSVFGYAAQIAKAAMDIAGLKRVTSDLAVVTHTEWENIADLTHGAFRLLSFNSDAAISDSAWGFSHLADDLDGGSPFYNMRMRIPIAGGRGPEDFRFLVGDVLVPTQWSEDTPDATYRYFDELGGVELADGARVHMQRATRFHQTEFSGDVPETPARDGQPASKKYVDDNASARGGKRLTLSPEYFPLDIDQTQASAYIIHLPVVPTGNLSVDFGGIVKAVNRVAAREVYTVTLDATDIQLLVLNHSVDKTILVQVTDAGNGHRYEEIVRVLATAPAPADAFTPSQDNLYEGVKAIFHPDTNSGVSADDANKELDLTGSEAAPGGRTALITVPSTATEIRLGIENQGLTPDNIRPSGALGTGGTATVYYLDYRDLAGKTVLITGGNADFNIQLAELANIANVNARDSFNQANEFFFINNKAQGNLTFLRPGGIADIRPTAAEGGAMVTPGHAAIIALWAHAGTRYALSVQSFRGTPTGILYLSRAPRNTEGIQGDWAVARISATETRFYQKTGAAAWSLRQTITSGGDTELTLAQQVGLLKGSVVPKVLTYTNYASLVTALTRTFRVRLLNGSVVTDDCWYEIAGPGAAPARAKLPQTSQPGLNLVLNDTAADLAATADTDMTEYTIAVKFFDAAVAGNQVGEIRHDVIMRNVSSSAGAATDLSNVDSDLTEAEKLTLFGKVKPKRTLAAWDTSRNRGDDLVLPADFASFYWLFVILDVTRPVAGEMTKSTLWIPTSSLGANTTFWRQTNLGDFTLSSRTFDVSLKAKVIYASLED